MLDRTLYPRLDHKVSSSLAKKVAISAMSLAIAFSVTSDVFAAKPSKTLRTTTPTTTTTTTTTTSPTDTTTTTVTTDTTTSTTTTTTTPPTTTTSDSSTTTSTTSPTTTDTAYDNRVGLGSDSNGIPILEKHSNARYIYWNPTLANANDSNPGTDPNFPKLTPAGAWNALRNGYGDWLLMAQGASWPEGFGYIANRSGLSAQYPIVVTTYDPGDPSNPTSMRKGIVTLGTDATQRLLASTSAQLSLNVVIENIAFSNAGFKNTSVFLNEYGSGLVSLNWLFHNVRFKYTQVSLASTGADKVNDVLTGVIFRHCSFSYAWLPSTEHAQGLYYERTKDITVEDSIFYHNGWLNSRDETNGADIYKHNLYIHTSAHNTMFRRNVSGWASSHGIQMRGGGTISDNVFASNPINILIGGGTNYYIDNPNGVSGTLTNNIVLGSSDINTKLPRGRGIDFSNTDATTIASGNIVANIVPSSGNTMLTTYNRASLMLDASPFDISTYPIYVTWNNNIEWNWNNTVNGVDLGIDKLIASSPNYHLTRNNNIIHYSTPFGTNLQQPATPFPDPSRDIGTYAASIGAGNEADLWAMMIDNPSKPWSKDISTYIRAGFNIY